MALLLPPLLIISVLAETIAVLRESQIQTSTSTSSEHAELENARVGYEPLGYTVQ
jgi:hypothetical protein